ncbi:MAG: cupin domain-containing protein [Clostridiales Family XIII bacterium]|nr:cupin domain-containing protein [Clostridiales Family XIII bacterium]
MKKLICEADVLALARQGQRTLYISSSALITPAAADAAAAGDIEVVREEALSDCRGYCPPGAGTIGDGVGTTGYGAKTTADGAGTTGYGAGTTGCAVKTTGDGVGTTGCGAKTTVDGVGTTVCVAKTTADGVDSELIYKALQAMASKMLIDGIWDEPKACSDLPYKSECDPAGLKIVRGGSVQMEFLDTGNPNNDVHYQELISSSDSKLMNAGFLEINQCSFNWEVACDEMYYVVQGSLSITVGGKQYTAVSGDVVNLPVGHTVVFSAPSRAKLFYAIKAAD